MESWKAPSFCAMRLLFYFIVGIHEFEHQCGGAQRLLEAVVEVANLRTG